MTGRGGRPTVEGRCLTCVYTWRDGRRRIIPLRAASRGSAVTTVKRSLDQIDTSGIDWRKVDATIEAEIARQIADDPDTAPDMAGRLAEARVVRPPAAVDVRAIRARLGLSQAAFARRYGFNRRTVQDWAQGRRRPEGPARLLLTLIDREPGLVDRVLAEAGVG